eukprot:CAMPEP_0197600136 /NCGR_PEP_ID=MMETSP1326-20131121/32725_1 /TAXON_ID=1155430 /ORGANISM="Genus nov. species nov., Strain RCC2288" /LENGTH=76 /DNA_ID=CAMNT_0043167199 /DNA_START=228 /DNA_END=456 /DNA_ORIENTATION=+
MQCSAAVRLLSPPPQLPSLARHERVGSYRASLAPGRSAVAPRMLKVRHRGVEEGAQHRARGWALWARQAPHGATAA